MNLNRVRTLNNVPHKPGPIVYWMSRDQRTHNNWALLYSQAIAIEQHQTLIVVFSLVTDFLHAQQQQFQFMLSGLKQVEVELQSLNIPFVLLEGDPSITIPAFINSIGAGHLVCDFSPLTIGRTWREHVSKSVTIRMDEVDAHNCIPAWTVSDKQEFAAYTIRPKIHRLLPDFLEPFPQLQSQKRNHTLQHRNNWNLLKKHKPYTWIDAGEAPAKKQLDVFISDGILLYTDLRNDPNANAQSNLSPYLHFGHLSTQWVVQQLKKTQSINSTEMFLEELVVRRELAENFCFYNTSYESSNSFPEWAKQTLHKHRNDRRDYLYSKEQFESAETHEGLWNAAQQQLRKIGKLHGYMRMYWAKKILEWSATPEEALHTAIYLNDKYELDGRDPNGYTGVAWAIGGVHDRPWFDRPVYGTVRYMNENGARKKFDVNKYIKTWLS